MTIDAKVLAQEFQDAGWSPEILRLLQNHGVNGVQMSVQISAEKIGLSVLLNYLTGIFSANFLDYELWALCAHSTAQPNTRIVKYKKLWQSIGFSELATNSVDSCEWPTTSEEGLRYIGLIKRDANNQKGIEKLLLEQQNCWLLFCEKNILMSQLQKYLETGWSNDFFFFPSELLKAIASNKWGLVRKMHPDPQGKETGLTFIAIPELSNNILDQ